MILTSWYPQPWSPPHWARAGLCDRWNTVEKLKHDSQGWVVKGTPAPALFSWLTLWGRQLPQSSLWKGPRGEELRPPANSPQWLASHEGTASEGDPPAPGKASKPQQPPLTSDSTLRRPRPEPPKSGATSKLLTTETVREMFSDVLATAFWVNFFCCWLRHVACRILVPQPMIEPRPSAMKARSPNHWTTGKFPEVTNYGAVVDASTAWTLWGQPIHPAQDTTSSDSLPNKRSIRSKSHLKCKSQRKKKQFFPVNKVQHNRAIFQVVKVHIDSGMFFSHTVHWNSYLNKQSK